MTDKAQAFTTELEALIRKYQPEVRVDWGYYGEVLGIEFVVDGTICATKDHDFNWRWDFGTGMDDIK